MSQDARTSPFNLEHRICHQIRLPSLSSAGKGAPAKHFGPGYCWSLSCMEHGGNLSLQWLSSLLPGLGELLILALPESISAESLALWHSTWRMLKEPAEGMVMMGSTLFGGTLCGCGSKPSGFSGLGPPGSAFPTHQL